MERYGSGAIFFHWVMFLLVIGVGVLGCLHDSWPKKTEEFWINVHAVCGLVLWFVLFARFGWRLRHPPPPLPAGIDPWSRRLAFPVHRALYALMFIIPIFGIVTFIWHGRVLNLGVLQVHFGIQKNKAVFEPTEDIHGYLAYALFTLASIHVLAGLWHHFARHDGVLGRMWPARGGGHRPP